MQRFSNAQSSRALSASRCATIWSSVREFPVPGGSTAEPVTASTEPQDPTGSSQRWAGGTLAATPKTIPCPGSPSTAAPSTSLSTFPTRSDSDELRRQGIQVKGLLCQAKFLVTHLAFFTWPPRYLDPLPLEQVVGGHRVGVLGLIFLCAKKMRFFLYPYYLGVGLGASVFEIPNPLGSFVTELWVRSLICYLPKPSILNGVFQIPYA